MGIEQFQAIDQEQIPDIKMLPTPVFDNMVRFNQGLEFLPERVVNRHLTTRRDERLMGRVTEVKVGGLQGSGKTNLVEALLYKLSVLLENKFLPGDRPRLFRMDLQDYIELARKKGDITNPVGEMTPEEYLVADHYKRRVHQALIDGFRSDIIIVDEAVYISERMRASVPVGVVRGGVEWMVERFGVRDLEAYMVIVTTNEKTRMDRVNNRVRGVSGRELAKVGNPAVAKQALNESVEIYADEIADHFKFTGRGAPRTARGAKRYFERNSDLVQPLFLETIVYPRLIESIYGSMYDDRAYYVPNPDLQEEVMLEDGQDDFRRLYSHFNVLRKMQTEARITENVHSLSLAMTLAEIGAWRGFPRF